MTSSQLRPYIAQLINSLDAHKILSNDELASLSVDYAEFIFDSTVKYIKGKKEHGGNLNDRNLDIEIDNELIDLFHYHSANKRRKKK